MLRSTAVLQHPRAALCSLGTRSVGAIGALTARSHPVQRLLVDASLDGRYACYFPTGRKGKLQARLCPCWDSQVLGFGPAALGGDGAGQWCADGVPCLGMQGEAGGTVPGLPSWQWDGK